LQYESSALAYEAALAGYGVAIGQKAMVTSELEDGRLVAPFDLWIDLGSFTYYFVMPRSPYRPRNDASITFRRWVESLAIEYGITRSPIPHSRFGGDLQGALERDANHVAVPILRKCFIADICSALA